MTLVESVSNTSSFRLGILLEECFRNCKKALAVSPQVRGMAYRCNIALLKVQYVKYKED